MYIQALESKFPQIVHAADRTKEIAPCRQNKHKDDRTLYVFALFIVYKRLYFFLVVYKRDREGEGEFFNLYRLHVNTIDFGRREKKV